MTQKVRHTLPEYVLLLDVSTFPVWGNTNSANTQSPVSMDPA